MSLALSDYEDDKKEPLNLGPILILLGFVFMLPVLLVATGVYLLLRLGRLKWTFIGFITLTLMALGAFVGWTFAAQESFMLYFSGGVDGLKDWELLVAPIVSASLLLGAPLGFLAVIWQLRTLRKNPHLLQDENSWTGNLTFRRTPWELLKKKRMERGLQKGSYYDPNRAPLGIDEEGEYRIAYRYVKEAHRHTIIAGTTGSGKTKTMQSLIRNDIINGLPTFVLDMKRDPEFASMLAAWAHESGGKFYHFVNGDPENYNVPHSPGQAFYDPLKAGNVDTKASMMLNMREFDSASDVYRQNNEQVLKVLFEALKHAKRDAEVLQERVTFDAQGHRIYDTAEFVRRPEIAPLLEKELQLHEARHGKRGGPPFNPVARLKDMSVIVTKQMNRIAWDAGGLHQVATALDGSNFEALLEACVGTPAEPRAIKLRASLDPKNSAGAGIRNAVNEIQGQMRTIMASESGRWLRRPEGDAESIDLFKISQEEGAVVLFSLNSDSEEDLSKFLGSLIMADINNVSARRRNNKISNPVMIYVDEFQVLTPSSVAGLIAKSRASGFAVTLALQSLEQIVASTPVNGEAYLRSILEAMANFIIHDGLEEDSAERLSKFFGKEKKVTYTVGTHHENFFLRFNWRNRREQRVQQKVEEDWKFPPSRFLELSSPTEQNGFLTTAILLNKQSMDPAFKRVKGSVGREVRIILSEDVRRSYYTPTESDEDSFEQEEFEDDFLQEWDELGEDDDPWSDDEKLSQEFLEEEEGGFVFEELEEEAPLAHENPEDDDSTPLLSFDVPEEVAPSARQSESIPRSRNEERTSSFERLLQGEAPPAPTPAPRRERITEAAPVKRDANPRIARSPEATPAQSAPQMSSPGDQEESVDLPSLEELMRPPKR